MYSVEITQTAEKQLKKLETNIQRRIISTLKRIRIRPHSHVKKLVGSNYFSLKIGSYRSILDIKRDKLIILVIKVGHRKGIYK